MSQEFIDYVRVEHDGVTTDIRMTYPGMQNYAEDIAIEAAKVDMNNAGGDLLDAECWPREYTVHMQCGPVKFDVSVAWEPTFEAHMAEA